MQIHRGQIQSLTEEANHHYAVTLTEHIQLFAPHHFTTLGKEQTLLIVQRSMFRAREYGFSKQGPIRLFVEFAFLFGYHFDTDPLFESCRRTALSQGALGADDQMDVADRMHRMAQNYLDAVSGPLLEHSTAALRRTLAAGPAAASLDRRHLHENALTQLRRFYPEKCDFFGAGKLQDLLQRAEHHAHANGLACNLGIFIITLLLFSFGHRALDDPTYPWISSTLSRSKGKKPAVRANRLTRRTLTYMQYMLEHLGHGDAHDRK